jgi:hypothetical protein
MDIYCRICGEPWDMDTLHEEIGERIAIGVFQALPDHDNYRQGSEQYARYRSAYDKCYDIVRDDFYSQGCAAMWAFSGRPEGQKPSWCVKQEPKSGKLTNSEAMSALIDFLGDDLDGIASMMDDAHYMGMID